MTDNQPTLIGALKYNFNELSGWSFGNPTFEEVMLYSDLVINSGASHGQNNIFTDVSDAEAKNPIALITTGHEPAHSDIILQNIISKFWGEPPPSRLYFGIMNVIDFNDKFKSKQNLFGIPYLSWDKFGILNENGNYYYIKRDMNNQVTKLNPLRRDVLYIKFLTILKILAVFLPTYYLIKYFLFRKSKPKPINL